MTASFLIVEKIALPHRLELREIDLPCILDINEWHRVVDLLANLAVAREDFDRGAFELIFIWRRSPGELSRPKFPDRAQ